MTNATTTPERTTFGPYTLARSTTHARGVRVTRTETGEHVATFYGADLTVGNAYVSVAKFEGHLSERSPEGQAIREASKGLLSAVSETAKRRGAAATILIIASRFDLGRLL